MFYPVLLAAALAAVLSVPAQAVGLRLRLTGGSRVAATGGLAVAAAWWLALLLIPVYPGNRAILGLMLAMVPLLGVSMADVARPLNYRAQFVGQFLTAAVVVFLGGIAVPYVTNPLGGLLYLNQINILGVPLLGGILALAWILMLMNAVNFLDGLDGVAAGVSSVGFMAIGLTSLLPHVNEPAVAASAFTAAAAVVGFLFWNFPPARLYLGTPGAWFLGFLLAVFSVQGSSKIATLAVVSAVPLLDAVAVVIRRLRMGVSPFEGDRRHLHHLLAHGGWSPRAILVLYVCVSAILAAGAVLLPTTLKVVLIGVALIATMVIAWMAGSPSGTKDPQI